MPETTGILALPSLQIPSIPGLAQISVPKLAAGRFTAPIAGWNHIRYTDAVLGGNLSFSRPPALLVVAEGRAGWFTPKQFVPPKIAIQLPQLQLPPLIQVPVPTVTVPPAFQVPPITIPSATIGSLNLQTITIPAVSIGIPTVSIPRVVTSAEDFAFRVGLIFPFSADWIALNWIRDGLKNAIGSILFIMWQIFVQPQIDQVQGATQGSINTFRDKIQSAVNGALASAKSAIQNAVNASITDVQSKLNAYRDQVNAALAQLTNGANANIEQFRVNVNKSLAAIPTGVQNALNSFGTGIATGANNAFAANRQQHQAALDAYRVSIQDQVNGGLGTVTGYTTQALNSVIPQLWAVLGLPQNQLFVPVLFKAALDGFDFYAVAPGIVVHYSAIGT